MEDLDKNEEGAQLDGIPPISEENDSGNTTPPAESLEEKELTDEEIQADIERLQQEVKGEDDAKEKRHKEQDIGWKMKILKERGKAKELEKLNQEKEERLKGFENTLLEEAYEKTIDDNFGLPYFENLAKTQPDLANKIAQQKWGKKDAKQLILDTKREMANNGDEDLKKQISEEDIRQSERDKIYHELALKQVDTIFSDLSEDEKIQARNYFDEIADGKKLNIDNVGKFADMAKFYATKDKKVEKPVIDKNERIVDMASAGFSSKSGGSLSGGETPNRESIIQQLVNSGVSRQLAEQMYK